MGRNGVAIPAETGKTAINPEEIVFVSKRENDHET
jgi:hypothetical protein